MVTNNDINGLKDKGAFKVPEGYFDNLTARVMDNIAKEEAGRVKTGNQNKKTISLWSRKPLWIGITSTVAACAAIIFTINVYTSSNTINDSDPLAINSVESAQGILDEEDMMSYALYDGDDVFAYLSGESYQ